MPYIGNKYEIGDHNNSWKTLDDISSYVATFDGSATNAVSTTNNTIRVPEHRFIQGQRVTYSNGGGGNIGGLTSGTAYYIIHDTNNEFKLATSLVNANNSTAINLSAVGSGSSHTVTAAFDGVNKKFKITYSGGKSSRFTSATQLSVAINNILQRPNDTTTFTDGFRISDNEKIEFNVAPVAADIFWGSILSASLPTFDISDNKLDNFTGDGSTTDFTLSHIPANNESIIVSINGVIQHPTDKNGTRAYSLDASILVFTAAPPNGVEIQVRHIGFAGASSSSVTGFYGRTGNVTLSSSADNAIVGVITATKFSGPFVGTITGGNDIVAGIITATKIDLNGDIDVDGHTNLDNVSVAGVTTAAGAIDLNADLDVDGHTNLDNVSVAGVSTFSGGAGAIEIPANSDIRFSSGSWTGNNDGKIQNHNNFLYLQGGSSGFIFRDNSTNNWWRIDSSGHFVPNTDSTVNIGENSKRVANFYADTATFTGNVSVGGTLTYEDVTNVDAVGLVTAREGIFLPDSKTIKLGNTSSSPDFTIQHNGTNSVINNTTGSLLFQNNGSSSAWINSSGVIYTNNDIIIQTANGNNILLDKSDNLLRFGDSVLARFGNDNDLEMYHTGSTGYIKNTTGTLYIQDDSNIIIGSVTGSETGAKYIKDGAYELYHNNKLRLSTWSDAVNIYGDQDTDAILHLYADQGDNAADKWRCLAAASGSNFSIQNYVNGSWETSVKATGNSHTELYHGDDIRFRTNGDGAEFFDSDNNCNVYFTCNGTRRGYLFVDSTNGGKIGFMDPQNHWLISGTKNSSVDLYHDNTLRLQTSSTGISVTGEVAATQDYPNYRPTLDFNFAAVKKLDPRITYSRTGPASYIDEYGKVVLVGANVPRFDHDPITRESKGLLIEEGRTNMITYSTDYTQSSLYQFSSYEGAISENLGTAPDGGLTDAFIGEGNTGRHTLYIKVGTSLSNNTKYSMSIFVKRVSDHSNERYCRLETASYSTWTHAGASATFDLSNGTEVTGSSANITSGIETYPDGWYRISMTSTTGTVAAGTGFYLNITNSSGSSASTTVTGSQGLFMYGTQMEAGDFITSFIPTNGETATRGTDVVRVEGQEFTDFYDTSEWTLLTITDATPASLVASPSSVNDIGFIGTNGNNYFKIRYVTDSTLDDAYIDGYGTSNSSIQFDFGGSHNEVDTSAIRNVKTALAAKVNDSALTYNGNTVEVDTGCALPLNVGTFYIGESPKQLYVKRIMYYPKRLPDAQLVTLTS